MFKGKRIFRQFISGFLLILIIQVSITVTAKGLGNSCEQALQGNNRALSYTDKLKQISFLNKKNSKIFGELKNILLATEYYDHEMLFPEFISTLLNEKKLESSKVESLWGERGDSREKKKGPFWNFLRSYNKFNSENFEISVESFKDIHKSLMSGGVEGISSRKLGKIRVWGIVGHEPYERLSDANINEVNRNIYLTYSREKESSNIGEVWYVLPSYAKASLLKRIENSHPKVYKKVIEFQKKIKELGEDKDYYENPKNLTREFVEALIEERIITFKKSLKGLDPKNNLSDKRKLIKFAALLQRDLVAIHPFDDGNGRTTRFFLNRILGKYDIAPMRLKNPNDDYVMSAKAWVKEVERWIKSSENLVNDILERLSTGRPISYSPYLSFIGLPETAKLFEKKSTKNILTKKNTEIDWRQFPPYIRALKKNRELDRGITSGSFEIKEMDELVQQFIGFFQKHTIKYIKNKSKNKSNDLVILRLVDDSFLKNFAIIKSSDSRQWKNKVEAHYNQKELIWRGLSDQVYEYLDKDIIDQFKSFTYHNLSNRRVNYGYQASSKRAHESLRKKIINDFKEYNSDVVNGDVIKMIMDHITVGDLYDKSYALSTSKKEFVGKAFAMGAMVIADHQNYRKEKYQNQLKARINIAAYPAEKDINVNRMRIIEAEFRSKYPRQVEFAAIGAIDPDVIMVVQKIDAKGDVETSFVRNPNQPNEIIKIKGRWVPLENSNKLPAEELILDRFILD